MALLSTLSFAFAMTDKLFSPAYGTSLLSQNLTVMPADIATILRRKDYMLHLLIYRLWCQRHRPVELCAKKDQNVFTIEDAFSCRPEDNNREFWRWQSAESLIEPFRAELRIPRHINLMSCCTYQLENPTFLWEKEFKLIAPIYGCDDRIESIRLASKLYYQMTARVETTGMEGTVFLPDPCFVLSPGSLLNHALSDGRNQNTLLDYLNHHCSDANWDKDRKPPHYKIWELERAIKSLTTPLDNLMLLPSELATILKSEHPATNESGLNLLIRKHAGKVLNSTHTIHHDTLTTPSKKIASILNLHEEDMSFFSVSCRFHSLRPTTHLHVFSLF